MRHKEKCDKHFKGKERAERLKINNIYTGKTNITMRAHYYKMLFHFHSSTVTAKV